MLIINQQSPSWARPTTTRGDTTRPVLTVYCLRTIPCCLTERARGASSWCSVRHCYCATHYSCPQIFFLHPTSSWSPALFLNHFFAARTGQLDATELERFKKQAGCLKMYPEYFTAGTGGQIPPLTLSHRPESQIVKRLTTRDGRPKSQVVKCLTGSIFSICILGLQLTIISIID